MRELTLVGLTTDGQRLLFADNTGAEYAVEADDKLRAVLRGDLARSGALESEMDSQMRPRDIQARIRAGATAEEVADAASVPVEKVLPYCLPVLAERQHMAELARRSHIRRRNADSPARRLFDVVAEQLRRRDVDPDWVSWDAWRREDGRWAVQASYRSDDSVRIAMFAYDAAGRYNVAQDDEARELIGEAPLNRSPELRAVGGAERRLAAVPDGGDLPASLPEEEGTDDLTAVVRAISDTDESADPPAQVLPAQPPPAAAEVVESGPAVTVDSDGYPRPDVGPDVAAVEQPSTEQLPATTEAGPASEVPVAEPAAERSPERRRRAAKRASVPSWDEIMLGGSGTDDAAT
jgi:hypothetical protein